MALQLSFAPILAAAPAENAASTKTSPVNAGDPILKIMQGELSRASSSLSKTDPAPYFLSYTVNDQNIVVLVGAYGSLLTDAALQRRQADVVMRVGSPALDKLGLRLQEQHHRPSNRAHVDRLVGRVEDEHPTAHRRRGRGIRPVPLVLGVRRHGPHRIGWDCALHVQAGSLAGAAR